MTHQNTHTCLSTFFLAAPRIELLSFAPITSEYITVPGASPQGWTHLESSSLQTGKVEQVEQSSQLKSMKCQWLTTVYHSLCRGEQ